MPLSLQIDCREKDLIRCCQKILEETQQKDIQLETKNLHLGDVIIDNKIIIERKTIKDLASSIIDGRYKEQGFRLHNCEYFNHNVLYIIEGDLDHYVPYSKHITKKTIVSSYISLMFAKGFSLYKTRNVNETAKFIFSLLEKTEKQPLHYNNTETLPGSNTHENVSYCDVTKNVKKNNITKENIGEIMLSQIPSVSRASASAIMNKHGSIPNLIKNMEDKTVLDDIKIAIKDNKERKISKTCIKNVYSYLDIS